MIQTSVGVIQSGKGRKSFIALIIMATAWATTWVGCTAKTPPLKSTFRLAWENSPRTTDPRYAIDADSQYLGDFLHCSLVKFDPEGKIQNQLASDLKWVNSTTLEITLKPNFSFSNRKPVTAEDVRANFDFFQSDAKDPSAFKSAFATLKQVEVVSPDKLRFHLTEPNGEFIYNLSLGILPKELAVGSRINDPMKVIGCGDFLMDKWAVGSIQLKRRIQDPQKSVQFIRIEIVKDENTRFLKLRNSELDLVQNSLNRDQLSKVSEYPNLKLLTGPGLNTMYVAFQLDDPILKQKKVRQAIAYAIDRKKIMEHLFHGRATAATTILTPTDPYFNSKLKPTEYNPEKAKRLLNEAGFTVNEKNPKLPRFTIKLKTTTNSTRMILSHTLAEELNQVGIALEVETMDWGKFKNDVDKGNAQMWLLNWIGFKGPDIYRYAFATSSMPPNGANRGRYSNPKLDELLLKAKGEVDFTLRKKLYDQAQEIVLGDLPYVFLWHEEQFALLNQRVNNYQLFADGRLSAIADATLTAESSQ